MQLSLQDKVVLITGASRGIGRACAVAFAARGAHLVITARSKDALQETSVLVQAGKRRILQVPADLTDRLQVKALFQKAKEVFGRIDILINNAGSGMSGRVSDLDSEKLNYLFRLNFLAPLWCIQEVLPIMQAQNSGQIINISSIAGKRGIPFAAGYSASKFALNGLTEALRVELKNTNIHVLLVCPAGTDTSFYARIMQSTPHDRRAPLSKLMRPEEVAEKILQASLKRKREIVVGYKGKLLVLLNWLNPALVDRLLAKHFGTK